MTCFSVFQCCYSQHSSGVMRRCVGVYMFAVLWIHVEEALGQSASSSLLSPSVPLLEAQEKFYHTPGISHFGWYWYMFVQKDLRFEISFGRTLGRGRNLYAVMLPWNLMVVFTVNPDKVFSSPAPTHAPCTVTYQITDYWLWLSWSWR